MSHTINHCKMNTCRPIFQMTLPIFSMLLLATFATTVVSHSFLTDPEPYTRDTCKGVSCKACQPDPPPNEARNSAQRPQKTWRRGQQVTIRWAKNNHDGGFIRLSLVPPAHRMQEYVVSQLTLYEGCFEQGLYQCFGLQCGADKTGRGFSRSFVVPSVVPDGIYVFAYLWYGGIDWRRRKGKFSDYASCSYVRIQGGQPLGGRFDPFFEAGVVEEHFRSDPPGKCLTSATRPEECKTGCDHRNVFYAIPAKFSGGKPQSIYRSSYYRYLS